MVLTSRPRSFGQPDPSVVARPGGTATLNVTVDLDLDDAQLAVFADRLREAVRVAVRLGALEGLGEADALIGRDEEPDPGRDTAEL